MALKSILGWSSSVLDVPLRRLDWNLTLVMSTLRGTQVWQKIPKDKLQVTQNKCIKFCFKLKCREHISNEHFERLNWLLTNLRFKQGVATTVFKFVQNKCSAYTNEIFRSTENIRMNTRNGYLKPYFSKTSTGQNGLFYSGSAIWNRISETLKKKRKLEYFQT